MERVFSPLHIKPKLYHAHPLHNLTALFLKNSLLIEEQVLLSDKKILSGNVLSPYPVF